MRKKIEFGTDVDFIEFPLPAKKYVPEWYKKSDRTIGDKLQVNNITASGLKTVKMCAPFLDSLTNGYVIELIQDVHVTKDAFGNQSLVWKIGEVEMAEYRDIEGLGGMPISSEYAQQAFAWKCHWVWRTPKGYSALVTHPLNRMDLPFTTFSGIVDSETAVSKGNLPFLIKKDFEGVIPAGTPIAQILPYKRESWEAVNNPALVTDGLKQSFLTNKVSGGWYKNNHWFKKDFF